MRGKIAGFVGRLNSTSCAVWIQVCSKLRQNQTTDEVEAIAAARDLLAHTNMRTESLSHKKGFDIDVVVRRLRHVTRNCEPAAIFTLAQEGFGSVFQVLVACIISGSVHEVVALRAARRLFARASTPAAI